mmetsp:Transcript_13884/g.41667  ORF Transcript_13884/g.41667 Transcript_13884/m.41667 type:complete len:218 (+) Transcript_13884:1165-1818(+)
MLRARQPIVQRVRLRHDAQMARRAPKVVEDRRAFDRRVARARERRAHDDRDGRRLARAVRAEDRDAVAPPQVERDALKQIVVAVAVRDALAVQHVEAAPRRLGEPEAQALFIGRRSLHEVRRRHQLLQRLLARLGLRGLGPRAVLVDEVFIRFYLCLLALVRGLPLLRALALLLQEARVVAVVRRAHAPVRVDDARADLVEKLAVVRDDDHGQRLFP